MSLEALPPELRLKILRFVGADELRKSTACTLTVCRWWHNMGEALLLRGLDLSAFELIHISRHSMEAAKARTFRMAIDVGIDKGPKDYPKRASDEVHAAAREADEPWIIPWATALARRLDEVGPWVRECKRLTSFSLRVEHDMSPEEVTVNESLSEWKQVDLGSALWASNLSDVKIDTLGAWLEADPNEDLCVCLARRLPALRSVWLRLHSICPSVLQFGNYSRLHDESDTRVEKIVISLSMIRDDSDIALFSSHCRGSEVREPEASEVWEKRAKKATEMLPGLKELWLLHHERDAGNHPKLIAREFVTNVSRKFRRKRYDEDGFDPTHESWDFVNVKLGDEDADEDADEDSDEDTGATEPSEEDTDDVEEDEA